ncbi:hypothetical protein ALISP_4199 [Alicycliphilus sp. B1]|nr:hypothetical protein ALISP_4199 [Alicycliphilus sp. B1]
MDTLRSLNRLRWWIAAWFIFSLGATLASPLVQPRSMELVCSAGSGATLVVHAKTGNAVLDTLGMDCGLCLLGSAPPQPAAARPACPANRSLPARAATRGAGHRSHGRSRRRRAAHHRFPFNTP